MKNQLLKSGLFFLLFTSFCSFLPIQKTAEIVIKSSTVCETCKETIEKNLTFEKGVKEVLVDYEKKEVKVVYRPDKTSPEKIKLALTKLGYDADEMKADPKAKAKLPACCQKEVHH